MLKGFWGGFMIAGALSVSGMGYLIYKTEKQPLMFPAFQTVDGKSYYSISGSIIGDNENSGPIDNYIDVTCWKGRMECEVLTQNAITSRYVSPIDKNTLKVRKWDDRDLIFDSEGQYPWQCNWYEIHANLKTNEISYTRIPNKKPDPALCQHSERKVFKWKIGNGRAWQTQPSQK